MLQSLGKEASEHINISKTLTLRNKIVEFASGARRVRFFTYNLFVPGNDIF